MFPNCHVVQITSGISLLKKAGFILALSLAFSTTTYAQSIPRPTSSKEECPLGWYFDGVECCAVGDECNPSGPPVPTGGSGNNNGNPTPPVAGGSSNNPPNTVSLCDFLGGTSWATLLGC